ncbi:MAG: GspH/FimT family pseudopilin [Gammaproteobacteria bacterium]|nr:GspH/FimT family pseudopilin [Gammaproteobacteria bacterium]MDH3411082.1 GspH/FimT family pseudopilin [Gammaproteobacteria bacterium]
MNNAADNGHGACHDGSLTELRVVALMAAARTSAVSHGREQGRIAYGMKRSATRGFTLVEMLVTITILGIVAAVTIPFLSSTPFYRLDIAANEVAEALRFARTESKRSNVPHGVDFSTTSNDAKVYALIAGTPTYNVYHPISKKIYSLNLMTDASTAGVNLQSYTITFQGVLGNQSLLGFSAEGVPKYYFFGRDHMLTNGTITLSYAGQTRTVIVSPMTGRVTVQ